MKQQQQPGFDIAALEKKITNLEQRFLETTTTGVKDPKSDVIDLLSQLKHRTNSIVHRIVTRPNLRWLGLTRPSIAVQEKQMEPDPGLPAADWNDARCNVVVAKYRDICKAMPTRSILDLIRKPTIDMWQWEDYELMVLMRWMFVELGLDASLHINMDVLDDWICAIYRGYLPVPFHNYFHCFCVAQMTYAFVWMLQLRDILQDLDILALIVAAISHDINHPGLNNTFQISVGTPLAHRYNDVAPLESHHCSYAFRLLDDPATNPFHNLTVEQFRRLREDMIRCISATDMGRHNDIVRNFRAIIDVFDIHEPEHKELLMQIVIKCADVSNEVRPPEVSLPWMRRLFEEFGKQYEREVEVGVKVTPFMNVNNVSKPSAQIGFIKFVLLPLYKLLADLFPVIETEVLDPLHRSLDYWTDLERVTKARQVSDRIEQINALVTGMNDFSLTPSNIMQRLDLY